MTGVAGFFWVLLTLLMILAIHELLESEGKTWNRYSYSLLTLIIPVWLYPLYTPGFRLIPGLIGNIVAGLLSIYVTCYVARSSRTPG